MIIFLRVVLETYTFLKGRQDNKWCSLKKFDFSNRTKKWDGGSTSVIPSNIKTTLFIVGRSAGSSWIHQSATLTIFFHHGLICFFPSQNLVQLPSNYEAWVRFGTRVRVRVRRDSTIKTLLKIFLFIFSIYFYY